MKSDKRQRKAVEWSLTSESFWRRTHRCGGNTLRMRRVPGSNFGWAIRLSRVGNFAAFSVWADELQNMDTKLTSTSSFPITWSPIVLNFLSDCTSYNLASHYEDTVTWAVCINVAKRSFISVINYRYLHKQSFLNYLYNSAKEKDIFIVISIYFICLIKLLCRSN